MMKKILNFIMVLMVTVMCSFGDEIINHTVQYNVPPKMPGGMTNSASIYDTNNVCMAGVIDTNYTVNIPTTWSAIDIYKYVDSMPTIVAGSNIVLTFDWDDGVHNYGTNTLNFGRIASHFNASYFNYIGNSASTNLTVRFIGNMADATACKLTVYDTSGWFMFYGNAPYSYFKGFTFQSTNVTRTGNGFLVAYGGKVVMDNCISSNFSRGFYCAQGGTFLSSLGNTAINCSEGFIVTGGANMTMNSGAIATNCSYGYGSDFSASGAFNNSKAYACDIGYRSWRRAAMSATSSTCVSNRIAYYAYQGGYIDATSSTEPAQCTLSSNPYFDTYNPDGSGMYKGGSDQTYNLYVGPAGTIADIQTVIDSIGKNLNGCLVTINLASNTYSTLAGQTAGLNIVGFHNGGANGYLNIRGTNSAAYVGVTNQATIINARAQTTGYAINIAGNSAYILVNGLKIYPPTSSGAIGVYVQRCPFVYLLRNSYYGTNSAVDSRGVTCGRGGYVLDWASSAVNLMWGWDGSYGNYMIDNCITSIATIPQYTASAYGSVILVGGTNYQGSVAKFAAQYGGLVVTNTGKILP